MTFDGLPAHPLLVHAMVVLLPLAALALVLHAVWPTARQRLGIVTPLLAVVALVLVPITTHAGEVLAETFVGNPLVQRHAELARQVLPWSAALAVLAIAQWWWGGRGRGVLVTATGPTAGRRTVTVALTVLSVAVAVGATVALVRAGDAGARATWGALG